MNKDKFREAMSSVASGISILTTKYKDQPLGITISSLTSVGIEPPTVLVCVENKSAMINAIRENGTFGITVLTHKQKETAIRFANPRLPHAERFLGIRFATVNRCPLLMGSMASMTCRVIKEIHQSGSVIFLGRINFIQSQSGHPLVYFRRKWQRLLP